MSFATADLCDAHPETVQVLAPSWRDFGRHSSFHGPIATIRAPEDNSLVAAVLEEGGRGRVLVVDGGGSQRCALVGGNLAALAARHGWVGIVVNGCVRDLAELVVTPIGIRALGSHPRKSAKRGEGQRDVAVTFGGVTFAPGSYLYADEDGVVVSDQALAPAP